MEYAEPTDYLTSDELEAELTPVYERLKLPKGRLELQTGIKRRGFFNKFIPSDISAKAAELCFKSISIAKKDIDLLIHSSVCRDFLEPSTASLVHQKIGLANHCIAFDLSNACLGFLNAMIVAANQIESGMINNALIVSGENSKALWDETKSFLNNNLEITRKGIKKYIANLTIGSMGVAYILSSNPVGAICKIEGAHSLCDTSSAHLCQGDGNTHGLMMETSSVELLEKGISLARETWTQTKQKLELHNPDHIIGHQVGIAHRESLIKALELDKSRDHITYDQFGNTGSAAAPMTLAYYRNLYKAHERVAMLGIGSGLHSVMIGMKWL